ncbi:MAG TPA: hypothetical protein VLS27_05805, partial [Gammaproteobacteria bacterium]|nr:hypothetical protein [Gammaproteobacteria bacterium]
WYAVFEDRPQKCELVEEHQPDDSRTGIRERFRAAKKTMMVSDRCMLGLWLLYKSTEQEDVIDGDGRLSGTIAVRLAEYRSRKPSQ